MISREYQKVLEKISSVELTRKESDRLKAISQDEKITKSLNASFDDPILGKVFVSSFEDPFFRPKFFDDPILAVDDRDVALTAEYNGRRRMSLTWPVLDRAKELLWVVGGSSKQDAVRLFLGNDASIPATLPTQARATVLLDVEAAGD